MTRSERAGASQLREPGESGAGAPSSAAAGHGSAAHLVKMANDIGDFFRSEPDRKEAIAGVANHIAKFWTPRMRQKLFAHIKEHGDGELNELPREALKKLAAQAGPVHPHEPPGGDAG